MNKVLKSKILEALGSVFPITIIVLVTGAVLVPMPTGTILMFLVGAALLIIGMGFFTLGADIAMMPMGEGVGVQITKSSNVIFALAVSFIMGFIITIAEPDLQVLSHQVPSMPSIAIITTVAMGVGIFLMISVLRTLLKIRLSILLIIFYVIVFVIAFLPITPAAFVPIAFDSGGVTTGPITVPFMLAMGVGVASIRSDRNSQDDSFGMVALCSVGPILAVLFLGIFYHPESTVVISDTLPEVATFGDVISSFVVKFPVYGKEVLIALGSIVIFFIVFQIIFRRYKKHQLLRIFIGFIYTFIGLVVFLTGVNIGFFPVGKIMGLELASSAYKWVLVPLGILIGYFIVAAEPAVHILTKQVEHISAGAIPEKLLKRGLSIGMSFALGITMLRIITGIPLMWIIIPGYAFAIILTFFVPKMFTGIAFDSGGVCSGPMTSTFLLPLAMGTCQGTGGDLMIDAFGIVAVVAMTPLIIIQLMGLLYVRKTRQAAKEIEQAVPEVTAATDTSEIIEFEEERGND